ncbi:hypothetical protein A2U01_0001569 [Trifolium medium]|uniref:Transmembrane protein n=1 Tax=Trifolium medium TaxID=97028 RepID=A0A392M0M3_9FABA|nr:hypothetical protein [Trifolium medium]
MSLPERGCRIWWRSSELVLWCFRVHAFSPAFCFSELLLVADWGGEGGCFGVVVVIREYWMHVDGVGGCLLVGFWCYLYGGVVDGVRIWRRRGLVSVMIVGATVRTLFESLKVSKSVEICRSLCIWVDLFRVGVGCFILGQCFCFFGVYFATTGLMVVPLSLPRLVCLGSRSTFVWSAVRLMELVLDSDGSSAFDSCLGVSV